MKHFTLVYKLNCETSQLSRLEQQVQDKDEMITKLKSVAMKSKKEAAVLKGKVGIYSPRFISRAVQNLNLLLRFKI